MIGYVTLGTNDMARAAAFYDSLLSLMGAKRAFETDRFIGWSSAPGAPMLAVCKPYDGLPATVGNGTMVALVVQTPEQVDAIYKKALELGATSEGEPGPRAEGMLYIAYFRDLDGNKLDAFCMMQK